MNANIKTLKQAKEALRPFGMTITRTQYGDEVRVTFSRDVPGYETSERREAVAYYTDDYDDAVSTGKSMHMQHSAVTNAAAQRVNEIRKGGV